MEWLDKIPNWIKIPLKILLPSLCIFSGFLLVASDSLLTKMFLKDFRDSQGFAFGLIFLICCSLIFCYLMSYIFIIIKDKAKVFVMRRNSLKQFIDIPDDYKSILYTMYKSPNYSIPLEISSSQATYLSDINAIGRSTISTFGYVFDFYLQPWVVCSIKITVKQIRKRIIKFEKNKEKLKNKSYFNLLNKNNEIDVANLKFLTE